MFYIETEKLRLELEVVPVESLFIHERILPSVANKLTIEFKTMGHLENPVIIDRNGIVLDGNHRVYVFRKLDFKTIPVCRIDYFHKNMQLRYWFRLLSNIRDVTLIKRVVEELGGWIQEVANRESLQSTLEENSYCCGIQQSDFFASVHFSEDKVHDAVSAYDVLEKIQERLSEMGLEFEYIPCQHAHKEEFCELLKDHEIIIWTPQITKEMVVEAAKQEKVFAPKSTRHLIPARPLNVNVPTHWLREKISLEEINKRFCRFLEAKEIKRLSPGQVIDGRFYEEELFVFYDKKIPS
jgi:hypothetical protein